MAADDFAAYLTPPGICSLSGVAPSSPRLVMYPTLCRLFLIDKLPNSYNPNPPRPNRQKFRSMFSRNELKGRDDPQTFIQARDNETEGHNAMTASSRSQLTLHSLPKDIS